VPGDVVQKHCTASVDGFIWACVDVECARYLPSGCRGWVRNDALGAVLDPATIQPCYPNLPCSDASNTCHVPSMDADGDGDVDQTDFAVFQRCLTGSGIHTIPSGCECFDRDPGSAGDSDIDGYDFMIFARCLSGPDVPADPSCDHP
jgi:hypothetical protein